jgi:hypothetical protein
VKRSGRDEPILVVIHKYMETTQGLSLYSYPYLKLAKPPCFSSTKLEFKRQVLPGSRVGGRRWPK